MVEQEMQNSPLRKNTAKIHLHLEKFSLKTNWRLAEILLYNQGCKKEPHGRKGNRWGELHRWKPSMRREQSEPHIGCPCPGVPHLEDKSTWLVGRPVGTMQLHTGVRGEGPWPRHSLAVRDESGSDPEQWLSNEGKAVIGIYTSRASEAVQVSKHGWTTIACTLTHAENPHQPLLLQHYSPPR